MTMMQRNVSAVSTSGRGEVSCLPPRSRGMPAQTKVPRRARARCQSLQRSYDDVSSLNQGKSKQEELSSEFSSYVSELVDVDRTGELLAWVFDSWFSRKSQVRG